MELEIEIRFCLCIDATIVRICCKDTSDNTYHRIKIDSNKEIKILHNTLENIRGDVYVSGD